MLPAKVFQEFNIFLLMIDGFFFVRLFVEERHRWLVAMQKTIDLALRKVKFLRLLLIIDIRK